MAKRFIVKKEDMEQIGQDQWRISGTEVKHIQVLRYNIGDEITINQLVCKIEKMTRTSMEVKVEKEAKQRGVPFFPLTLYMAILKGDKMDTVIQKAVEMGVTKIVPFFSSHVIAKLDEKGKQKKKEKWQNIVKEACKQCGRTDEVILSDLISFQEVLEEIKEQETVILAYEKNKQEGSLKKVLEQMKEKEQHKIACMIGPEGGFLEKEVEDLLRNTNVTSVSLGSRILRAETASFFLISIIMYELDHKEKGDEIKK